MITAHTAIIALILLFGAAALNYMGIVPISDLFQALAPYAGPLIALLIIYFILVEIRRGAGSVILAILKGILAIIFFIVFLVFIFPVMIADTFLLGSLAHWMWKYQVGPILAILLSSLAFVLVMAYEGKLTYGFTEKFLGVAIGLALGIIVWNWASQEWTNTHRLVFIFNGGRLSSIDPAASIQVKAGDKIKFTAFGRIETATGKEYPPQGDLADRVAYNDWYRPRGEMELRVGTRTKPEAPVPALNIQSGREDLFGLKIYYDSGYFIQGEATIPKGVEGRLSVGYFDLLPDSGFARVTLQLNLETSEVGRILEGWYAYILYAVLLLLAVSGLAKVLNYVLPSRVWVFVAVILFIATAVRFVEVKGIIFPSLPWPTPAPGPGAELPPPEKDLIFMADGTVAFRRRGVEFVLDAGQKGVFRFRPEGVVFLRGEGIVLAASDPNVLRYKGGEVRDIGAFLGRYPVMRVQNRKGLPFWLELQAGGRDLKFRAD